MNAASLFKNKMEDVSIFLAVAEQIPVICIQDITPHEALHGVLQNIEYHLLAY